MRPKSDGVSYHTTCPQCGREKMEVHTRKNLWFCHRCGKGGRMEGEVRFISERREVPEQVVQEWRSCSPCSPNSPLWTYLQSRSLPDWLIREMNPHEGPDPWYVYFPFYRFAETEPCYFIGRCISDSGDRRYDNPPRGVFPVSKNEIVWGLQRFQKPVEELVICEGIFDAVWKKNRVAILGKNLSEQQIKLILPLVRKEIILYLDEDAQQQAYSEAVRLARVWSGRLSLALCPEGTDPDDLRGQDQEIFLRRHRLC